MHTDRCHARQTNNTGMRVAILGKIGPPDKEVKEGEADPFNNMAADNRQQALRKQLTRAISRRRNLPTRNSAYRGKGLSRSQSDGSIWPHLLPLTEVGFRFHPCCINKTFEHLTTLYKANHGARTTSKWDARIPSSRCNISSTTVLVHLRLCHERNFPLMLKNTTTPANAERRGVACVRSRVRRNFEVRNFDFCFSRMDTTRTKRKSNPILIGYAPLETWKLRCAKNPNGHALIVCWTTQHTIQETKPKFRSTC